MSQPGVEIGSGMPSRPLPGLSSADPVMTISWQGALSTMHGAMGCRDCLDPARIDLFEWAADADPVDLAIGCKPADQDRYVVLASLAVGHIGEEERFAILLLDAAAKLPTHQRVHLGIFVDRTVDLDQQSCLIERSEMIVEIGIGPAWREGGFPFRLGYGVHFSNSSLW